MSRSPVFKPLAGFIWQHVVRNAIICDIVLSVCLLPFRGHSSWARRQKQRSLLLKVSFKIQLLNKMGTEETFKSKLDFVDLVNLVRSIQRAEGNNDCYRSGWQQCDRMSCVWRDHCLKEPGGALKAGSESHQHNKATDPSRNKTAYPKNQSWKVYGEENRHYFWAGAG